MAKAKQVVKSFLDLMSEVDNDDWRAFLYREEERMKRKFFPMGKALGEESRLIAYMNYIATRPEWQPKSVETYKFFMAWKQVSGFMPFEGRVGTHPGKRAEIALVNEALQYYFERFMKKSFTFGMTQADWDEDFEKQAKKLFGEPFYAPVEKDDIPF